MKYILYKPLQLGLALLTVATLSGCTKDNPEGGGGNDGDVPVTITLSTPIPTRALTDAQDSEINTVHVLSFRDNGTGNPDTFLYYAEGEQLNPGSPTTSVVVPLKQSQRSEKQRLVFLANLDDDLITLLDTFTEGTTKEAIQQQLIFDVYNPAETDDTKRIWDTSTPRYLPMWGESPGSYIITYSFQSYQVGTINLLRSVARVDIVLNPDASLAPQGFGSLFRLEDIKVYNASQQGYVIPDAGNLTAGEAEYPTVPVTNTLNKIGYKTTASTEYLGTEREIYIGEYSNTDGSGNNKTHNDISCLIISGYYDGSPTKTWYRLDFMKNKATYERWDILRNNRYVFYVTSVAGPGYGTEQEAFDSTPINIESLVIPWNNGNMDGVQFDGQNYLRVTPLALAFWKHPATGNQIEIDTDHPDGWTYEVTDSDQPGGDPVTWITNIAVTKGTPDILSFDVQEKYLPHVRAGYIHITAGRLSIVVNIEQSNDDPDLFDITPTGYIPAAGQVRTVTGYQGVKIRAYDLTNGVTLEEKIIGAALTETLEVPAWHPVDQKRYVAFQFLNGQTGQWENITADSQERVVLSATGRERVVALYYADAAGSHTLDRMVWSVAMGVPYPHYQTHSIYGDNLGGIDESNFGYIPITLTGCGTYSEEGYPAGTWRVPTFWELNEMDKNREPIADIWSDAHWASDEDSPNRVDWAYFYDMSKTQQLYMAGKVEGYYARCVRENLPLNLQIITSDLPAQIPRTGGTYTVLATGFFPNLLVRAYDATNGTTLATETLYGHYGTNGVDITIPPNDKFNTSPVIELHWSDDNGATWDSTPIYTGIQDGYFFTVECDNHLNGNNFTGTGQTVDITVTGTFPSLKFNAWDYTNATDASPKPLSTVPAGINATEKTSIYIFNNGTAATKDIALLYTENLPLVGMNWHTIVRDDQPAGNFELPSGRLVAAKDASADGFSNPANLRWHVAMGISSLYETASYPEQDVPKYTLDYSISNGGCAAYWEGSPTDGKTGQGNWRLPTFTELQAININKSLIPALTLSYYYSSTEYTGINDATIRYVYMNSGSTGGRPKTTGAYARCVRESDK